ncbi:MAG: hypothetical protein EAY75_07480 [Bacteroidetes bacterium]|nr:MAG: hypothetical protein EAY75_07480 [Bacteroidota bacterium]
MRTFKIVQHHTIKKPRLLYTTGVVISKMPRTLTASAFQYYQIGKNKYEFYSGVALCKAWFATLWHPQTQPL